MSGTHPDTRALLRQENCGRRVKLSAEEQQAHSEKLLENIRGWLDAAATPKTDSTTILEASLLGASNIGASNIGASNSGTPRLNVGAYLAVRGEIDLTPSLKWFLDQHYNVYLPVIVSAQAATPMRFAPYTKHTKFTQGAYNINIPDVSNEALVEGDKLDVVFVPLTAFDNRGNRLGMGGGFYDRTFSFRRTEEGHNDNGIRQFFVGVAHDFQKSVDPLPIEDWDLPLDAVITEQCIYDFR